MKSVAMLMLSLVCCVLAYRFYGRFLSRLFGVDPSRKTPAHEMRDGVDYEPAKSWWVLFGHHFSSIAGAGPVVGPVLASAYWGWGIPLIWLLLGSVFMGAVADYASLVISIRHQGESIAKISGKLVSGRVRIYFTVFLWVALLLVIAVFAVFGAKTLVEEAEAVIPSFGLIPTAVLTGWMLYRSKIPYAISTVVGLVILAALIMAGTQYPLVLPTLWGLKPQTLWLMILFIYCFFASVIPVQILLQPRDYLASFILLAVVGIGAVSILIVRPEIQSPAFIAWTPTDWPKAGPLWPMLFCTIACGAISGFHAMVSTGTTSKQLSCESHACRIGYGGMLTESFMGVMVLIVVCAGLSRVELGAHLKAGGPISAFSHGYGNICSVILGDYGKTFAVLGLNAFILTTLDTCTRIMRYITSEFMGIKNKYVATIIVIVAGCFLAFSESWNLLWPAFGTSNQMIAAIALLVVAVWLARSGKRIRIALIPAAIMIMTTLAAFSLQFRNAWASGNTFLAALTGVLILLEVVLVAELLVAVYKIRQKESPAA